MRAHHMLAALSAVVPLVLAIVLAEVVWMVLADAQPAYDDMGGLVHRSVPYRCAVAATTGFALLLRYLPLRRRLGPADWRFCACSLSVVGEQAPGIMWREFSECRHTCLVSNIFTDFIRVYARPDSRINEVEAQWITWMLLGPRGSYHVPVCIRCGPQGRYAEIQYGSGKSDGLGDFCDNYIGWRYGAIWVRHFNEGGSQDVIWHADVDDGPRRFCRYGFDEVRVATADGRPPMATEASWRRHPDGFWRLRVAGSYRTGNNRSPRVGPGPCATPTTALPPPDPADLPLPTPTTPSTDGEELTSIDPPWLAALTDDASTATLIEYRWRGRVVHWASFQSEERFHDPDPDWRHRCADDWDNCLDAEFLRFTGATDLLAPEEVYERDRRDWESDTWYRRYA